MIHECKFALCNNTGRKRTKSSVSIIGPNRLQNLDAERKPLNLCSNKERENVPIAKNRPFFQNNVIPKSSTASTLNKSMSHENRVGNIHFQKSNSFNLGNKTNYPYEIIPSKAQYIPGLKSLSEETRMTKPTPPVWSYLKIDHQQIENHPTISE